MAALAVTALQVLEVIGLGALGFLVVILVCAGILGMLQMILPSVDSGAEAAVTSPAETTGEADGNGSPGVDTEANA